MRLPLNYEMDKHHISRLYIEKLFFFKTILISLYIYEIAFFTAK